mmetsp:Transcript_14016/g.34252  ORF Transcript_14016/g.34252 Transcript_14016/m.34252 type:complete len:730 (+) Transcript_14016:23-2212(+)
MAGRSAMNYAIAPPPEPVDDDYDFDDIPEPSSHHSGPPAHSGMLTSRTTKTTGSLRSDDEDEDNTPEAKIKMRKTLRAKLVKQRADGASPEWVSDIFDTGTTFQIIPDQNTSAGRAAEAAALVGRGRVKDRIANWGPSAIQEYSGQRPSIEEVYGRADGKKAEFKERTAEEKREILRQRATAGAMPKPPPRTIDEPEEMPVPPPRNAFYDNDPNVKKKKKVRRKRTPLGTEEGADMQEFWDENPWLMDPDMYDEYRQKRMGHGADDYHSEDEQPFDFDEPLELTLTPMMEDAILHILSTQAYEPNMCIRICKGGNIYKLGLDSQQVLAHLIALMRMPEEKPGAWEAEDARRKFRRRRAAIAVTNMVPNSERIRKRACKAGAIPISLDMMTDDRSDNHLKRLSVALLSNLSVDTKTKEILLKVGAIKVLSRFLVPSVDDIDTRATVSHAAACLWSVCIGVPESKKQIDATIVKNLLKVAGNKEPDYVYAAKMAVGAIGELCIGNEKHVKEELVKQGAIGILMERLKQKDPDAQRLAASGLCNLTSKNEKIKRQARKAGCVDSLCQILQKTSSKDTACAAAGGLFNIVGPKDLPILELHGVIPLMRMIPISEAICEKLTVDPANYPVVGQMEALDTPYLQVDDAFSPSYPATGDYDDDDYDSPKSSQVPKEGGKSSLGSHRGHPSPNERGPATAQAEEMRRQVAEAQARGETYTREVSDDMRKISMGSSRR